MKLPRRVVWMAARNRARLGGPVVEAALELACLLEPAAALPRPHTMLPSVRRVLAIAPHPDDETIGCGGTLARLADAGARVEVALVTDGGATLGSRHPPAETAARRRAEAVAACRVLGTRSPHCLGLQDGRVATQLSKLVDGLGAVIAEVRPELLILPWVLDAHPDHRAISRALAHLVAPDDRAVDALRGGRTLVWGYEAHTPIPWPDQVVDITGVLGRKQAALDAHGTAGLAFELHTTLALNHWRSLATRGGLGAAEAFLTVPLAQLPAAVAAADRAFAAAERRVTATRR